MCQFLSKADFPLLSKHPLKQQGLVVIISNHNSVIRGRSALSETKNQLQSRPIEMRATILYLANRWTEFEMLLTPLRLLYLVMFSLLSFPSLPQFIAHFCQISSFLCIVLPFSNSYRNESCSKACSAHFAPAAILFFLLFCE